MYIPLSRECVDNNLETSNIKLLIINNSCLQLNDFCTVFHSNNPQVKVSKRLNKVVASKKQQSIKLQIIRVNGLFNRKG